MQVSFLPSRLSAQTGATQDAPAASPASQPGAPAPLPDDHWSQFGDLTQSFQRMVTNCQFGLLTHTNALCLLKTVQHVEELRLPPDRLELLRAWRANLGNGQASICSDPTAMMVMSKEDVCGLSNLLKDIQITHSQRLHGKWAPLDPRDEHSTRKLGEWMRAAPRAESLQRCDTARKLLSQRAGLTSECSFGTDHQSPTLPDAPLLRSLMRGTTRAHVTLPGTLEQARALESSLSALPLRTWRVGHLDTLHWLLNAGPANLHTLDLQLLQGPMTSETHALIRKASESAPNLASILSSVGLQSVGLGGGWTSTPLEFGTCAYNRTDRPDGLKLLDAAVQSCEGETMSTHMPIRHKASYPDAACLLVLAKELGGSKRPDVDLQLRTMLSRAAASDQAMHDYAEAVRSEQKKGTPPVALMAAVHQQMTSALSTAAALARAEPRQWDFTTKL